MAKTMNYPALLIIFSALLLLFSLFISSPFYPIPNSNQPTSSSESNPPHTTITEVFGVKIERNPPQSKLDDLGVSTWPKSNGQPGKIPWTFKTTETMYLLEGKVKVSVDGYEGSFEIWAGNLVVFPEGMRITWNVLEAVTKHYSLEKDVNKES